jgi:tRNA nucleotidyltransferase (CCA-adding enzyme)
MQIYLVGGAVRDKLLGLEVRERDWVVVGATPRQMLDLGYTQVGKSFPVFLHPQTHEEYALARTERKTAPGYAGFEFHFSPDVTLEQDLLRRDLTINAIAEHPDGSLIDPYGGEDDVRDGVLRHVSLAFAEDPVRILRVARFAARFARWGFRVAHGTNRLMQKMVDNGEVDALVAERVWQEMAKALQEDQPARFFEVLAACGALPRIFPELQSFFGSAAAALPEHGKSKQIPALQRLTAAAALSPDLPARLAVLLYEPQAGENALQAIHGLADRLRLPNDCRELAELLLRHAATAARALELTAPEWLALLEALDAFRREPRFQLFLTACRAVGCGEAAQLRLQQAREAAAKIDIKALGSRRGEDMRQAVRQARIAALNAVPGLRYRATLG